MSAPSITPAQESRLDRLVEKIRASEKSGKEKALAWLRERIRTGRYLTEAKAIAGHGNYGSWLMREFMWSADTARRRTRIFELCKNRNLRNLANSIASLDLLAAPSTPEEVRGEFLGRAEAGEEVTRAEVTQALRTVRLDVTKRTIGLPVIGYPGKSTPLLLSPPPGTLETPYESKPAAEPDPFIEETAQKLEIMSRNAARLTKTLELERDSAEAINSLLRFGQAAKAGLDICFIRTRLREKKCEDEFFDALDQAIDLLRWLKPENLRNRNRAGVHAFSAAHAGQYGFVSAPYNYDAEYQRNKTINITRK